MKLGENNMVKYSPILQNDLTNIRNTTGISFAQIRIGLFIALIYFSCYLNYCTCSLNQANNQTIFSAFVVIPC